MIKLVLLIVFIILLTASTIERLGVKEVSFCLFAIVCHMILLRNYAHHVVATFPNFNLTSASFDEHHGVVALDVIVSTDIISFIHIFVGSEFRFFELKFSPI